MQSFWGGCIACADERRFLWYKFTCNGILIIRILPCPVSPSTKPKMKYVAMCPYRLFSIVCNVMALLCALDSIVCIYRYRYIGDEYFAYTHTFTKIQDTFTLATHHPRKKTSNSHTFLPKKSCSYRNGLCSAKQDHLHRKNRKIAFNIYQHALNHIPFNICTHIWCIFIILFNHFIIVFMQCIQ